MACGASVEFPRCTELFVPVRPRQGAGPHAVCGSRTAPPGLAHAHRRLLGGLLRQLVFALLSRCPADRPRRPKEAPKWKELPIQSERAESKETLALALQSSAPAPFSLLQSLF